MANGKKVPSYGPMVKIMEEAIEMLDMEGLKDRLLKESLDELIPEMLRKPAFIDKLFERMPGLLGNNSLFDEVSALSLLKTCNDQGVIMFMDVAFLKQANNYGYQVGDELLRIVADAIIASVRMSGTKDYLYGRWQQGDEFILYMRSKAAAEWVYATIYKTLEDKVLYDLPVRVDVGYVYYSETAEVYLNLIGKKVLPVERDRKRNFFDIALKIAQKRMEISKVIARAEYFFVLFKEVYEGKLSESDYNEFVTDMTRGGKFVVPQESWLSMDKEKLYHNIFLLTMEKIDSFIGLSEYDKEILRMAVRKFERLL